jgi:hypothetical protein
MGSSMIYFCLHGSFIVTDPIELSTIFKNSLHLTKELRFMVVRAYREFLSLLTRQYSSRVANIDKMQLVILIIQNIPTTMSTSAQEPLVSQ